MKLEEEIVELNKRVFGNDDSYSTQPEQLKRCAIYFIRNDQDEIVSFALIRPGRISTLERYGVRPDLQGTGLGGAILRAVCEKYPVIHTYVSTLNIASAAALCRAGFMPAGGSGEWLTLIYVRSDKYPVKKVRAPIPAPQEKLPEPP